MSASLPRERVPTVDSAWLHMDDAANLMVVTLLLVFEEPIPYERIRQLVQTRLLKIPRFRQRIVERRQAAPCWEDDPHVDLDAHLEIAELDAPADEEALRRFVSTALSRPLDSTRPLWRFFFVPRYRNGSALVARVHHCIGDGFGLMYAFLSLADHPERLAVNEGSTRCAGLASDGRGSFGRAMTGAATAARLLMMSADPATPLKGPLSVEKRATWSRPLPLERVKAASRATGVSVNDVLLAGVAGALRSYLLSQRRIEDDLSVRSVVPINLRGNGDAHLLGNRFGLLFLALPVGMSDPAERLAEIGRRMRALKQSPEPIVTFRILSALGVVPRRLFDAAIDLFGRKATAIVTNVSGPREAITYAGVRLSQAMFWVPCAGKLGLGISLLSYAGHVSIGFASDAGLIPDPDTIVKAFDREIATLFEYSRQGSAAFRMAG